MTYIPDCLEDNTYKEKYLNKSDKEYIKGFDYSVEEALESFFANIDAYDLTVDGEGIDLGRVLENHEDIGEKLKEALKNILNPREMK